MRSSRVKMRSRPIVTSVPLPLVPTDLDNDDDPDEALLLQPPPHASSISIPIPPIHYDEQYYTRFPYPPYHPPQHYIKFHLSTPASLYSAYDHYDLLQDDVDWLTAFNAEQERQRSSTDASAPPAPSLSEESMGALLDLFEKDAGVITVRGELMSSEDKIDVSRYYTLAKAIMSAATGLHLKGRAVEAAYHYWIDKRKRLGKALLRIFQEPPPKGNTDPHVAFRPRLEGRRVSKRNPRKDDISAYQKMLTLRKDFARVIDIVDAITSREKDKRDHHLLDTQIFDERLALSYHAQRLSSTPGALSALQAATLANPLTAWMTAAPATVSALSLFRTTLPACTWVRPEKKKVKKAAAKAALPSATSGSSASSGSMSSKNASGRVKVKSSSKKDSLPPLSSASPSLSSLSSSASPHRPELYEDAADYSSDDDLLSEDDDDRAYFASVERFVKRMRSAPSSSVLHSASNLFSSPALSAASSPALPPYSFQSSVEAAFPDDETLPPSELITPPPGVPAVLGRCRGRVGRAGKLWIDPATYLSVGRGGGSV